MGGEGYSLKKLLTFFTFACVCVNTWVRLEMNTTMAPLHRLMKATTPQNVIEAL